MNKVKSLLDNIGYIQIEEGTTATDYVPYQSNAQQLTHEPLRAVGNVKDKYIMIDGKWYIERKYGEAVLDGSVVSGDVSSYFPSDNSSIFFIKKEDAKSYDNLLACDKFMPNINVSNSENRNVEGIFTSVNGSITAFYFRIFNNKLSTQDINGCKQYLQQNPVTVVYQLTSPQYEPIDYNPFETYADITHISTNSLIPTNVVVKNHGYNCILKPSTKYTISSNLGLNTVTTPSTLTEDCLRFMDTDTSDVTTMKDVLILEGDWTTKADLIPANFDGIESAFEQELVTEETDEHYGKYKVNIKVANEDKTKENNITFYLNEPLRGVESVKDRVFIQDGKVVVQRNCGSITLDGSAPNRGDNKRCYHIWTNSTGNTVNGYVFLNEVIEGLHEKIAPFSKIQCTILPSNRGGHIQREEGMILTFDYFGFSIHKSKLSVIDVNDLQNNELKVSEWFENNPVTVVYQLAEPVYEEADCDLSKLALENYENSSLIFESNIPVSANIRYSGEVPVVTQAKSLSSQVDNTTLDIN